MGHPPKQTSEATRLEGSSPKHPSNSEASRFFLVLSAIPLENQHRAEPGWAIRLINMTDAKRINLPDIIRSF
ncbi:hypothetical protein AX768_10635 [Burkholderia sp. PAMC 28687]|nr:hypothetical protein AX768_10635 [Burkholderia sp. PAMC 28687]